MLSTLEGELPRTRGPNPLFWTHTLAHLSLAPDHLQLTLPPPRPVYPCRTYCRLSCLLRHSKLLPSHPQRQTRHIARSVALLPRRASSFPSSLSPFLPVLHVQFCITIRRTLRKLPRNFSLPRARPPLSAPAGQLRAGSINSLSLFARATRANAIHRTCFSSLSFQYQYVSFSRV